MMFHLVSGILESGATPEHVVEVIPGRGNQLFEVFEGELDAEAAQEAIMKSDVGGKVPRTKRFFCNDGELFHSANRTYALSNQWGKKALVAAAALGESFPDLQIDVRPTGEQAAAQS